MKNGVNIAWAEGVLREEPTGPILFRSLCHYFLTSLAMNVYLLCWFHFTESVRLNMQLGYHRYLLQVSNTPR